MSPLFPIRALMTVGWLVTATSLAHAQNVPFPIKPGIAAATRMGTDVKMTSSTPIPDGFVAVLLDISNPAGMRWFSLWQDVGQGGTLARYHSPNWISKNLGQVFGLTLGDPDSSDFYVAATGIYGFEPGIKNYFAPSAGPELKGSVWRLNPLGGLQKVDYELVANLPTTGASLGQIAYNPKHRLLYVSNFADGKIHVLVAPGNTLVAGGYVPNQTTSLTTYSHSPLVYLAPSDVNSNPDLLFPHFELASTDPLYAQQIAGYGSRIWAVAYEPNENRLYYSVVNVDYRNADKNAKGPNNKNEIWSVGLDGTGQFIVGSSRLEVKIPFYPVQGDIPSPTLNAPVWPANSFSFGVSDISFSNDGKSMAIAERGELLSRPPMVSGFDYTGAHIARVMSFALSTSTGRQWLSSDPVDLSGTYPPGSYGTFNGQFKRHTNSAGGVDFADGYGSAPSQADVYLWSTVNSYDNKAYVNNDVPVSPTQRIYGAQGMLFSDAKTRVVPAPMNLPGDPPKLFSVDYDGNTETYAKNQIGDIEVRRKSISSLACNCATIESYSIRDRTLSAKVCTPALNFSEIRVVQGNVILTPSSIIPPLPLSGSPPYCVNIQVQLTGTGTQQVHFELASQANSETSLSQCCRSPIIAVALPKE